jgi:hypothetical protein
MRPENDDSDDRRADGGHQDGARRDILGLAYQGVKVLRGRVSEQFQSGIQRLGCPNGGGGNHDPTPFRRGEMKEKSRYRDDDGTGGVNPCVVLRAKNVDDSVNSVSKTLDSTRKLEWAAHCGGIMAGLHSLSEYELHIGSHVHCLFCWEGESHPRLRYRGLTGIERAGSYY